MNLRWVLNFKATTASESKQSGVIPMNLGLILVIKATMNSENKQSDVDMYLNLNYMYASKDYGKDDRLWEKE